MEGHVASDERGASGTPSLSSAQKGLLSREPYTAIDGHLGRGGKERHAWILSLRRCRGQVTSVPGTLSSWDKIKSPLRLLPGWL